MTRNKGIGLLLLAFVLGILMGLGLGWQVWPVQWYDTDPADLRVNHQEEWVLMTADSLTVNGDVDLARDRLARLMDDDTGWDHVAALVHQVAAKRQTAGDGAAATRVERLATLTGLPVAGTTEFAPPRRTLAQSISWLGYVILGVGFLIVAAALVVAVFARRRQADATAATGDESVTNPAPGARMGPAVHTSAGTVPLWGPDAYRGAARTVRPPQDGGANPASHRMDAYAGAARARREETVIPVYSEEDEEEDAESYPGGVEESSGMAADSPAGATGEYLGTYRVDYVLGADHFEVSHAIESGADLVGDCGVVIADVLESEGVQRVDAFEVWLHDLRERGSKPQDSTCLLISEYAGRTDAIREGLAFKGPAYITRPNMSITLETESLRLLATVIDMAYAEDDQMPNSYFSRMALELRVERKQGI